MTNEHKQIEQRKNEHIDIVLQQNVNAERITTGFDRYQFKHNALPELDFQGISLDTQFLNKKMKTPLLVSAMTGGSQRAEMINLHLAEVAEHRGWAMSVGSIRAALENEQLAHTYQIRKVAPTIPILSNLGAVQLNYGYTIEHCQRAVDMIEADALVLHLNSIQEVIQPEGNTNFNDLLSKIEKLCRQIDVPVGVKEVGWGISADVAVKLVEAGVSFIDVAGAGGTSWSQVEKYRSVDPIYKRAAETFADWGNKTADCIIEVRNSLPLQTVIGSGGIQNGKEAAMAICLGANLVGFGQSLLCAAATSQRDVEQRLSQIELELRIAMFGLGIQCVDDLIGNASLLRVRSDPSS